MGKLVDNGTCMSPKARQTEFTVYCHRPHRFVDFHKKKIQISKSPPIVLAIEGAVQDGATIWPNVGICLSHRQQSLHNSVVSGDGGP